MHAGVVGQTIDLVVPVKHLAGAKSRLRGAADRGAGDAAAHSRLALALARDTVAAALAASRVRHLVVVSSDPVVAAALTGVEVVPEGATPGLNPAYAHGEALLRARDAGTPIGALQADLPALRAEELDGAIAEFLASGAHRAFCTDADGGGTTFLVSAGSRALQPLFGAGSAARHAASGAVALRGDWPGLRHDVDTSADLRAAARLGVGEHTAEVLTSGS